MKNWFLIGKLERAGYKKDSTIVMYLFAFDLSDRK